MKAVVRRSKVVSHWHNTPNQLFLLLFSHSVVSEMLPYGLQDARLPYPSLSSRVCSNLYPLNSLMPSNHLILYCPILLLPLIFPSIRVFSSESVLRIRWPKYWSFSFNNSPSNDYSGLISFRMDWFGVETNGLLAANPQLLKSTMHPEGIQDREKQNAALIKLRCIAKE